MIKLELEYLDAVRLKEIALINSRIPSDDQGMWTFIYVQLTNAIYPPEDTADDSFLEMAYEDRFRSDTENENDF
jgi:hypothetical protein